jgi:HK97 family phage major capsid protein
MSTSFAEYKSALEVETKTLSEVVASIAKDGLEVDGANVTIDEKRYKTVQETKGRIKQLRDLMSTDAELKELKSFMEGSSDDLPANFGDLDDYKTVADYLFDSTEFKDMMDAGRYSMRDDLRLPMADITAKGGYGQKDIYSAREIGPAGSGKTIGRVVQTLPQLEAPKITNRVRDLFPVARTNANLIEYFKTLGLTDEGRGVRRLGNAQTVAERTSDNSNFGLKPKSDIGFTSASDPIRTIAHWIPAHRNTLADKPQLRSIINGELMYGLALEEDWQLLKGDGVGENLLGLLNRPGIQSYTSAAVELKSDSLRRAQTLCELAYFPASGYVVHPNDWEDIELQKGTTNDQYMLVSNVAVGAQSRVWRLPVVSTPMIDENTFLTASFGQAAQVYDREQANIRVAEQHADFFIRNAVVFLAEERLGLVVQRPEGVVKGTFKSA